MMHWNTEVCPTKRMSVGPEGEGVDFEIALELACSLHEHCKTKTSTVRDTKREVPKSCIQMMKPYAQITITLT